MPPRPRCTSTFTPPFSRSHHALLFDRYLTRCTPHLSPSPTPLSRACTTPSLTGRCFVREVLHRRTVPPPLSRPPTSSNCLCLRLCSLPFVYLRAVPFGENASAYRHSRARHTARAAAPLLRLPSHWTRLLLSLLFASAGNALMVMAKRSHGSQNELQWPLGNLIHGIRNPLRSPPVPSVLLPPR